MVDNAVKWLSEAPFCYRGEKPTDNYSSNLLKMVVLSHEGRMEVIIKDLIKSDRNSISHFQKTEMESGGKKIYFTKHLHKGIALIGFFLERLILSESLQLVSLS